MCLVWLWQFPLPAEVLDGRCELRVAIEGYDFIEGDSLQALHEVFAHVNEGRGLAMMDTGDTLVLSARSARVPRLRAPGHSRRTRTRIRGWFGPLGLL